GVPATGRPGCASDSSGWCPPRCGCRCVSRSAHGPTTFVTGPRYRARSVSGDNRLRNARTSSRSLACAILGQLASADCLTPGVCVMAPLSTTDVEVTMKDLPYTLRRTNAAYWSATIALSTTPL